MEHMNKKYITLFILLCFNLPLSLEVQYRNRINENEQSIQYYREKISTIDQILFEENDYVKGLQECKELLRMVERFDEIKRFAPQVECYIDLIENYADFDQKPLSLFFKARKIENMWNRAEGHTKESVKEQGDLYRELLEQYPQCNLAGFIQYLLGMHYKAQIGSSLTYLDREVAVQKAIEAYRNVIEKYPSAVFPIWGSHRESFKVGSRIAPTAQMNIAWLYESGFSSETGSDIPRALEAYQAVIDHYPGAVDPEDHRLDLGAYLSMINIYSGKTGYIEFIDTAKVKEICQILLNDYPNQEYEIWGWYFGAIHPEALMQLAKMETEEKKVIEIYRKIIERYPNSWTGKSGSGAVSLYSVEALENIIHLLDNPLQGIEECRDIINSDADERICGAAQYKIAQIFEEDIKDSTQALIEYQKVIDEYDDVVLGGEAVTLGEGARSAIQRLKDLSDEEKSRPLPRSIPPRRP